jgi:subtilisin-like proprotein convertase family protein
MHQRIQRGLLALATSFAVAGAASAAPPSAQVGPLHAALASAANAQAMGISKPIAVRANAVAVSRPLADIAREQATVEFDGTSEGPGPVNPFLKKGPLKATELQYADRDGAISEGGRAPNVMPPTIVNFEGMNNTANGQLFGFTVSPPDTNGDIGRTHYVQTVNLAVQVFNINGSPLTAPFKMSGLFAALGASSLCSTDDDGDPIVLYDHLADRWMISQFALTPPFHQCIAISQTGDPTGAYFVYDFVMPNNYANDYPHFGVWPDAYYMTDNEFNSSLTAFTGAGAFAFDRAKMLVGDPTATYIYFDQPAALGIGGQLPSDLDGPPPPVGAGNIFAMFTANEFGDPGGDGLRLWEFKPNFATPASSTFTELTTEAVPIPVAAFSPLSPTGRGDVPQPGTTVRLDTISDRLMFRLQYRNFGAYETLAVNHTVNVGPDTTLANYRAGVRYYELRRTGGATNPWTIREQATHAPADNVHRWMGSTALDRAGNQAVGFSTSAATVVFPSVSIAGRLVGDPLGGLAQGESTIAAGSRVQTSGGNRWGDYSMLGVDPVDDCTFWFTSEYYTAPAPALCSTTATQCWQTRIASFRFPTCAAAPLPGTIQGRVTNSITGQAVGGAVVRAGNGYAGTTDSTGNYSVFIPGGTFNMATIKTGYSSGTATGVVVPVGGRVTQNFQIQGVPILTLPSAVTFDDSGPGGNNNGVIDIDECVAISVPATNEGGAPATGTNGTLSSSTTDVTIPTNVQSYGSINPGASASPAAPFILQTGTNFVAGTPISALLGLAATEGSWNQSYVLPTGSPAGAPVAFAATGPIPIPDNNPVGATLNLPVAGLTSPIGKVTVSLHLTHTFNGDIAISLIGPDNTTVVLSANRGGSGDNFGTDCPAGANDTTFNDSAATAIGSGTSPFVGSFRPDQPLAAFNGKSGAAANGNWRLFVVDNAGLDIGNIQCVTVNIDGFAATSAGCATPQPDNLFQNGFEEPVR